MEILGCFQIYEIRELGPLVAENLKNSASRLVATRFLNEQFIKGDVIHGT
jgi:hypothetical protein